MPRSEIETIEAGPELDRLVAEACGIEYERDPNPSGLHEWEDVYLRQSGRRGSVSHCLKCHRIYTEGYCEPPPPETGCKPDPILFRPSTDWNEAMRAAEKVGLLKTYQLEQSQNGRYEVRECDMHGHVLISEHQSGPVAICRAILKLKASKP
jgi:hypothetical protein